MGLRSNQGLRYVLIPANSTIAISEHISKVETLRLSCDAAYYIPALLRAGPFAFNITSNPHLVIPFPTFNECLKDNVPLFFFKRSEHRDKQENIRAKQLLDLFSDKLSKRQNTFYGDVLVFWRRNVDEIRHKMKLTDFALSDASRLLGLSITSSAQNIINENIKNDILTNGTLSVTKTDNNNNNILDNIEQCEENNYDIKHEDNNIQDKNKNNNLLRNKNQRTSSRDNDMLNLRASYGFKITPKDTDQKSPTSMSDNKQRLITKEPISDRSNNIQDDELFNLVISFLETLQQQLPVVVSLVQYLQTHQTSLYDNISHDQLKNFQDKLTDQVRYTSALRLAASTRNNDNRDTSSYMDDSTSRLAEELSHIRDDTIGHGSNSPKSEVSLLGGYKTSNTSLLQYNKITGGRQSGGSSDVDLLLPRTYISNTNKEEILFPGDKDSTNNNVCSHIDSNTIVETKYIVTQAYKPVDYSATDQFAQLAEGAIVNVIKDDPSGWWWVTDGTTTGSGWFPFSFLEPQH